MGIRIKGIGAYVPDQILTNFDLEKMVETSDEWIRTRTGIEERRIAAPEQATSDMAYEACVKALRQAKLEASDIDAIIVATITPDHVFPSTGCLLQNRLNANNAMSFDLEAACSGFLYSLEVGYSLLKATKRYRNILVVGAEKLSCLVNWEDRNTCVLFGDGAGAAVIGEDGTDSGDFLIDSDLHADGSYTEILNMPAGGSRIPASVESVQDKLHTIKMAGKDVFKLAVNGMVSSSRKILEESGLSAQDIKYVVPHQANSRIIDAVAQRLEIPERVYCNVNRYGNTSAASIPICLNELSGELKRGDYLLLTAFGGGLTWGAMLIQY